MRYQLMFIKNKDGNYGCCLIAFLLSYFNLLKNKVGNQSFLHHENNVGNHYSVNFNKSAVKDRFNLLKKENEQNDKNEV